jgi:hypothetical protein
MEMSKEQDKARAEDKENPNSTGPSSETGADAPGSEKDEKPQKGLSSEKAELSDEQTKDQVDEQPKDDETSPKKSEVEKEETVDAQDSGTGEAPEHKEEEAEVGDSENEQEKQEAPVTATTTTEENPEAEEDTPDEDHEKGNAEDKAEQGDEQEQGSVPEDDFEHLDYSKYNKTELVEALENLVKGSFNIKEIDYVLKETRPVFDAIVDKERKAALDKFVAEGGEEDDFEFRLDEEINRYEASYRALSDRKSDHYKNLESQKERNLELKNELLEKLRQLVDGDETTTSINALKELQAEWKKVGPIPRQHNKSMWANYNAIIDRFYDNRSIYFELKELDRKKNLNSKIALCEKAEQLVQMKDLKVAIEELNKLHEEFKHIGPVPIEEKDNIWIRFKSASDAIYDRRRETFKELKKELHENAEKKRKLADALAPFKEFTSDRISEWNKKTKEILDIQKKWEAIGGLPRESAKEINKSFWSAFKSFFNNKSAFFKQLEGQREENLEKKKQLVQQAEEWKDSEDWDKAAEMLKKLQADWREIGPVPEKVKDEVYQSFKKACDHFFNRKREHERHEEKEYYANLEQKEKICIEIDAMAEAKTIDLDLLEEKMDHYRQIGFVPRNAIKKIQNRLKESLDKFVASAEGLDEQEKEDLELKVEFLMVKSGPFSRNKLFRKEVNLKKQIGELENDISTWKNNMEFFADSSTADKLKGDFEEKIESAQEKLKELKKQLRVIKNF